MGQQVIGMLGGSGLYQMEGLSDLQPIELTTPFGDPSDTYFTGDLEGRKLVFLPRHGRNHQIAPHEVNYCANIHGFKQLGAQWLISISAVGSMRETIKPGDVVIIDQLFDRTKSRQSTFFGEGIVGHIPFADPLCGALSELLYHAAVAEGATVHKGGTYICIEGPQFSTRAESRIYRSWGVDVIGMTNLPEAKLAREAGLCYATIAMPTDYDCWHESEEDVSVEAIVHQLQQNAALACRIARTAALQIPPERSCDCTAEIRHAVMTNLDHVDPAVRKKLALILGEEAGI